MLALDLRKRRAGFVVFEPSMKLLEWGVRTFDRTISDPYRAASIRLDDLVGYYTPRIIVVRESRFTRHLTTRLRAGYGGRGILIHVFRASSVRNFFIERGCANKHEISLRISELFKELSWKLPPKRKPWQSENHNMTIFDAVAVALMFFGRDDGSRNRLARPLKADV